MPKAGRLPRRDVDASGAMTRDPALGPVLVFGASSQIGFFLLPMLVERGARDMAVTRRVQTAPSAVAWLRGNLPYQPPQIADDVDSIVRFGTLDVLAAWLKHKKASALRRVIATSSMSAESKR